MPAAKRDQAGRTNRLWLRSARFHTNKRYLHSQLCDASSDNDEARTTEDSIAFDSGDASGEAPDALESELGGEGFVGLEPLDPATAETVAEETVTMVVGYSENMLDT